MVVGCGDDSGGGGDGGSAGAGGTAGTGGDAGMGGDGGMGGSGPELAVTVEWFATETCQMSVPSVYDVGVIVTNAVGTVAISGNVAACTPNIDAESNELTCPNNAPYGGQVVVQDDNGTASVDFTINVCEDGSESS